jgi:hypothetical protein
MVWAVSHDNTNGTQARALLKGLGKKVADLPKIEQQAAQQQPPKAIPLCRWVRQPKHRQYGLTKLTSFSDKLWRVVSIRIQERHEGWNLADDGR